MTVPAMQPQGSLFCDGLVDGGDWVERREVILRLLMAVSFASVYCPNRSSSAGTCT
jgi:hypothetical protein